MRDVVFFVIFFSLVVTKNAYAYIDPGLGSFITQFLIATFLGLMCFFRRIKEFIVDFVGTLFKKNDRKS